LKRPNHFFEIHENLTLFISALDDVIIQRYDKQHESRSSVELRYVLAPKQRVLHDIVNKSDNITLPVASVEVKSISRAKNRVFNKLLSSPIIQQLSESPNSVVNYPSPIPIDISVDVSFVAKYMNDIDQIISNILPNCNPYFIISWKVPEEYGFEYDQEIRTEVLWNETVSYDNPTVLSHNDKYRIAATTSFTIKGWLFKDTNNAQGNIFKVDANFYAVSKEEKLHEWEDYYNLEEKYSPRDLSYTDTITISGNPTITELKFRQPNTSFELNTTSDTILQKDKESILVVQGESLNYSNEFFLSSGTCDVDATLTEISVNTTKFNTISAYNISEYVTLLSETVAIIELPPNIVISPGTSTIVTANSAGWDSSFNNSGSNITFE
jgi:hypothetical protein